MVEVTEEYNFDSEFGLEVQKRFLTLLVYEVKWAKLTGLEIVKPEYFDNKILHNICFWIQDYYKNYDSAPTLTILAEMATGFVNDTVGLSQRDYYRYKEYLDDIFELDEKEKLDYFKDKAVDFAKQIRWKKAMDKASKFLRCKKYSDAMQLFSNIMQIGTDDDLGIQFNKMDIGEFLNDLNKQYDPATMIHTGIPSWDKALGGGFVKDNLHLIGGAPGFGKSKLLAYLTKKSLEDGKRVVFITLELNEQETMTNVLVSTVGMTMSELRDPVNREKMIDKITTFRNTYCSDLVVKFYKPSTITTNVIHNYIQKVIQRKKDEEGIDWKPDVIFLDYMDKLLPVDKIKGNIYEDNGGVADDCKNLAIDFECPVITGSQLGRASWNLKGDEVISMASIAESARKAHLAHSLTTINANPQEKELGKSRLYIAKSRGGTPGKVIYLEHNLGRNNFYEIEPWTQEQIAGAVSFSVKDTTSGGSK